MLKLIELQCKKDKIFVNPKYVATVSETVEKGLFIVYLSSGDHITVSDKSIEHVVNALKGLATT